MLSTATFNLMRRDAMVSWSVGFASFLYGAITIGTGAFALFLITLPIPIFFLLRLLNNYFEEKHLAMTSLLAIAAGVCGGGISGSGFIEILLLTFGFFWLFTESIPAHRLWFSQ